jgi:hypothetical protein
VGAAVALVVVVTLAMSWQRRDSAVLHGELTDIKAQLAGLNASAVHVPGAVGPSTAASTSRRRPARTYEEQQALDREASRRAVAAFEQDLHQEPRDSAWGTQVKQQIDGAMTTLTSQLPGVKEQSVDCGSTLCRVVVTHEDQSSQKEMAAKISRIAPFDNEVYYLYDHDSLPRRTTVYFARAESHLPRPID